MPSSITRSITARVPNTEAEEIERLAHFQGLSTSAFAARLLHKALRAS